MKRILITGSTDGIGLETAKSLVSRGHSVLLHGRSAEKLERVEQLLKSSFDHPQVESYVADLSRMPEVESLARAVLEKHESLDVLINNAGVFVVPEAITPEGLDLRFVVNTIAPYLLTKRLLPIMGNSGRVINLSSAAQARASGDVLFENRHLDNDEAYAQSKFALTAWSRGLAESLGAEGPAIIAVNPGSLLASNMVKEAFGIDGKDIRIGAEILTRAALDDEFADASGKYFDNDAGQFANPHPDAVDPAKTTEILQAIEFVLAGLANDGKRAESC